MTWIQENKTCLLHHNRSLHTRTHWWIMDYVFSLMTLSPSRLVDAVINISKPLSQLKRLIESTCSGIPPTSITGSFSVALKSIKMNGIGLGRVYLLWSCLSFALNSLQCILQCRATVVHYGSSTVCNSTVVTLFKGGSYSYAGFKCSIFLNRLDEWGSILSFSRIYFPASPNFIYHVVSCIIIAVSMLIQFDLTIQMC